MGEKMKKIAVIHTTPVTIAAMKKEIINLDSSVEVINFLDDSMLPEINKKETITSDVTYRLHTLMNMAQVAGADAILCACSSIGGVFEEGKEILSIPVFRIDEPMANQAAGYKKVAVAATLKSTILPTTELIRRKAKANGNEIKIETKIIENVGGLLSEGKEKEYDSIVLKELEKLAENNDIVVLAQASMARAISDIPEERKSKFLTSPQSGVAAMFQKK